MEEDNTTQALSADYIPQILAAGEACIVQIYGGEIGKRYPIVGEISVGRDDDNAIVLPMDSVSRQHALFFAVATASCVKDLGSTNGTRVNGNLIHGETQLRNGDLVKIGGAIFKFITGGNVEALYHEEIYRMAIIDGLTEVYNKRYMLEFLEREVSRCQRHHRDLSVVMFDLDHFKKLNDTYGHLAGDHVLKRLAEVIVSKVRQEDLVARYGGEEFVLVLPETGPADAEIFAEKLRSLVEATTFEFDGVELRTTISMGIASLDPSLDTKGLLRIADERLYQAKHEGRNRVVAA